jgi:hypothetical protein
MYTNRRRARARVSDDSVMRDVTTETRDLCVSVHHAGASRLCVSHVVALPTPAPISPSRPTATLPHTAPLTPAPDRSTLCPTVAPLGRYSNIGSNNRHCSHLHVHHSISNGSAFSLPRSGAFQWWWLLPPSDRLRAGAPAMSVVGSHLLPNEPFLCANQLWGEETEVPLTCGSPFQCQ